MATQVEYPLAAPTISGNNITVDLMLNEPTRISRYLADISLPRFIYPRIFSTPGEKVSGGAVVYDQLTANDLYLDASRSVQNVEPGAEFPIVTSSKTSPKVALVEKFGGKTFITDEARDRNNESKFRQEIQKVSNSITLGMNARAIAALEASVSAFSTTATGVSWSTANSTAAGTITKAMAPATDFAKAQLSADTTELGVNFNLWLVNPAQYASFVQYYGADAVASVLAASGIEMIASNRVAAGTAYAVEAGQVGEIRFEQGLNTETWREHATERTWVQSSIRPVFVVTNPYSVLKFTGLA